MKISLNWLKELVDIPCSTTELAHRLTMAGLEVEAIDDDSARYEKVVVGFVKTRIKHPNADTLSVCGVDVGTGVMQEIVCGAPNVDAGQKVAVALVGAKIGDIVISKRKLRGIVSNGMICSQRELGLGESHEGIMVLEDRAVVGQPFAEYYGADTVFEIGITPNRADALSHIGVARDVAALFGKEVRRPALSDKSDPSAKGINTLATVEINEPDLCPRYVATVIRGITVGPSPAWLVERLARVGLRSINNVVDATNLVLMECGHPLHAFDYDKLAGHKIAVRCATAGETFVTLDGKSRTLDEKMLLICDGERGVAIAGVMGGANAEITPDTKNVLIESAYFNPSSIRRTAKTLGLSTDASYRFERGTDIENTVYAADRVSALIKELAGGMIAIGRIDVYPKPQKQKAITVRPDRVNALLGAPVLRQEMLDICGRLGIAVSNSDSNQSDPSDATDLKSFAATVPTWRPDMHEEVDVIEEIARIAGFDRFMPATPRMTISALMERAETDNLHRVREFLAANGYCEAVTNSLIDEKTAKEFSTEYVRIANPISNDMAVVIPHPLPQLLSAVALNKRHGTHDLRLFELSRAYQVRSGNGTSVDARYSGTQWLTLVIAGNASKSWEGTSRPADFFDVKGDLTRLLEHLPLDNVRFIAYNYDENRLLTAQSVAIFHAGRTIGTCGQVHPGVLKKFDIDGAVFVAMVEAAPLRRGRGDKPAKYAAPPKFPWIVRDLAVVAPREHSAEAVLGMVTSASASPLLRSVQLFDVFEGPPAVAEGHRSLAYSLTFGADDRTLRDQEIDAIVARIVNELQHRHHLSIRA